MNLTDAIQTVNDHGLTVESPIYHKPETPRQFCKRVGLHAGSLGRTMARLPEGIPAIVKRGTTKTLRKNRIISIRSTTELERWIQQRKQKSGLFSSVNKDL